MSVRVVPDWYARSIGNIKSHLHRLRSRGLYVRAIGFEVITLRERDAVSIEDYVDFDALCQFHFKFGEEQALKYVAVAQHYSKQDLRRCELGVTALAALAEVTPLHRQLIIELAGDNSVAELQRAAQEAEGIEDYQQARAVIKAILQPTLDAKAAPPEPKPAPPLDERLLSLSKLIHRAVLGLTLSCKQYEQGDSACEFTLEQIRLGVSILSDLARKLSRARPPPRSPRSGATPPATRRPRRPPSRPPPPPPRLRPIGQTTPATPATTSPKSPPPRPQGWIGGRCALRQSDVLYDVLRQPVFSLRYDHSSVK